MRETRAKPMRAGRRGTLLILPVISLAVSLGLAEGLVRKVRPQNLSGSWRVETDKGLVINKSHGSARHQCADRVVYYHFSGCGFRDSAFDEGAVNILVLGDSFTFGWLLNPEDTYVARLQRHADAAFYGRRFNLVNAAAGGWGLSDYLAYLEDFGDRLKPDVVLVFVNSGDVWRSTGPDGKYRLAADGATLERVVHQPNRLKRLANALPAYQWLLEHSHLFQLARNAAANAHPRRARGPRPRDSAPPDLARGPAMHEQAGGSEAAVRLARALLRRMNAWCRERGIPLWVTTTGWHEPHRYGVDGKGMSSFLAHAEEFFAQESIPYRDLSGRVRPIVDQDFTAHIIAGDGHPNERAAALIAEAAWADFLEERLRSYASDHPEK